MLMPWVDGVQAFRLEPDDPDRRAAMSQAGQVQRRLDTIEATPDPMPIEEALARRMKSWAERGRLAVGEELTERALAAFDTRWAVGMHRRWCHRDFEPRNWLVEHTETGPRLWVVDFGQARVDLWLWDLVKLDTGCWVEQPSSRAAFFEGFGRPLTEVEELGLRQLGVLHGYQSLVWGREHGDVHFERLGLEILRRRLT